MQDYYFWSSLPKKLCSFQIKVRKRKTVTVLFKMYRYNIFIEYFIGDMFVNVIMM